MPAGRKAIKSKWVLDYKPGHKGVEPRYKAKLVACGYDQLYGVDYLATYSPIVKHYSILLVLAIVAALNLQMLQLDIKTAFLYGKLEEIIYMCQPEGYVSPGKEKDVCKLNKPIFGLKQASNCWNFEFNKFLVDFGFQRSKYDRCVYFRIRPDGEYTILIIYVDDGLACSNRPEIFGAIIEHLRNHFQVRSLPPNRFVGLHISRDKGNRTLSINQPDFIRRMMKRYNMEDCNTVSIPADPNYRVTAKMSPTTEQEKKDMEKCPMRELVGSLMYLANMTRPDIAYAINQVSAFVANPGHGHWNAIKPILTYFAGTVNHGISFGGNEMDAETPLIGFTDADLSTDLVKRKSTTGFMFQLYGGGVFWVSQRQRATALSTTNAEFYAASEGSRDCIWFKAILAELGIDVGTVPMYCDSNCAISIIRDPEDHQRVKHIDVKYFFIRYQQEIGTLKMVKIPTDDQIADIFTKPLPKKRFERLRRMLGIREIKE